MSVVETGAQTLAKHTTLRLGGPAGRFVEARTTEDLVAEVAKADAAGEPLLLLGGGSNLVVADTGFAGTVLKIATEGSEFSADDADGADPSTIQVDVEAGADWDTFVASTVEAGLGGLECLSGIPGSVGATPIQNVGAYGCEIETSLRSILLYDRRSGQTRTLPAHELGLGYRTSALKGADAGVVLRVRLALYRDGYSSPIRYAELARALGVEVGARVPAAAARAAVLGLRAGKGMVLDAADHDTWSAGSFFTNPVLTEHDATEVISAISKIVGPDTTVPQYPSPGGVKLSAAWLIESAGFRKGHPGPGERVCLSHKHTLALTNRGQARTDDLLALAREVRAGVAARFGVELRPEPLLINCAL